MTKKNTRNMWDIIGSYDENALKEYCSGKINIFQQQNGMLFTYGYI